MLHCGVVFTHTIFSEIKKIGYITGDVTDYLMLSGALEAGFSLWR